MMIIAGYEDELDKCFFSFNPGLKRRFSSHYKIDKYSCDELIEIFKLKIKNSKYVLNISDKDINSFFKSNYNNFKYFGGDIEKIVSEIKYSQSFRTFSNNIENNDIIFKDLEDAFKSFKSNRNEKCNLPPFGLYV